MARPDKLVLQSPRLEPILVTGELKLIIIARAVIPVNSFPSFNNYLANHMMLLDKLMGLPQVKRVEWP
ncbi:hypothetical protein WP50_17610 [Lactiplantibacillus plantarum]|nr:hypothetical protein WP50_17610 [Lactiplantibacillus plantarum]